MGDTGEYIGKKVGMKIRRVDWKSNPIFVLYEAY
jgi:hypothetical protein